MSIEDIPDELLVDIFENVPGVDRMYNISKRLSNIVIDIKRRVLENPEKYLGDFSEPVCFLLYNPKYHRNIWNKAIIKGDLYLITKLVESGYEFDVDTCLGKVAYRGHKDLVDFFILHNANN